MANQRCLLLINMDDTAYAKKFAQLLPAGEAHKATVLTGAKELFEIKALTKGFDFVITTSHEVCSVLFGKKFKPIGSDGQGEVVSNYAGNIVKLANGVEVLIMIPFRQLYSTDEGQFLTKRFLSKIFQPEQWMKLPPFEHKIVDSIERHKELLDKIYLPECIACSVDIETSTKIYCIGFGLVFLDSTLPCGYRVDTYTVPLKDAYDVTTCRTALESPVGKIYQNGLYDNTHLLTYHMPVNNWLWDTMGMFHSWFSELPRRLDFIATFCLRDAVYWKDEKKSDTLYDKYMYNGKDVYITSCIFMAWMAEAPEYARTNYALMFPSVFPSLYCGLEGVAVCPEMKQVIEQEQTDILDKELTDIHTALGAPNFNTNSPLQVKTMLHCFGNPKATGTSEDTLVASTKLSPILAYVCGRIVKVRKARKLLSTYIETPLLHNRLMYGLNPFGTDTGRMAAKASNLHECINGKFVNYGTNIQNQPEYAKQMLIADEGYLLFEIDKKASESYCTAELSRDIKLQDAVYNAPDFHSHNASMFFGIPFDDLWDTVKGKTKNKPIRQLSKRINHGANYNMGAQVLVQTMGEDEIWKAKILILSTMKDKNSFEYKNLNQCLTTMQVATYLLSLFDKAYPNVRGRWQQEIIKEVTTTRMLKSPSGWTRYCFGNPADSKPALNAYVAHGPQHLSVFMVNKSLVQIWRQLVIGNTHNFRIKAQIHDSIFGQVRIGQEHLVEEAEKLMRVKIIVHGRTLEIPNDIEGGKKYWKVDESRKTLIVPK